VRDCRVTASHVPSEQLSMFASLPGEQRRVWLIDSRTRATYTLACN